MRFFQYSSIGDFVWEDVDADGIQDAHERGIAGIKFYLLNTSAVLLDSVVSDLNGRYSFSKVLPGIITYGFIHQIRMQSLILVREIILPRTMIFWEILHLKFLV
ncbi:MAG: hypothetical protein IPG87_12875 [Saprospiraceae bacterium]|nr:hypothetical protein [Candidatus Vicinibacter affinis]